MSVHCELRAPAAGSNSTADPLLPLSRTLLLQDVHVNAHAPAAGGFASAAARKTAGTAGERVEATSTIGHTAETRQLHLPITAVQ